MSDSATESSSETVDVSLSRIDRERPEDRSADVKAILVIFVAATLFAVHFISGWTF
ncbi:MAG: hypothetical protein AAGE43_09210 [Pseudomonadota bacterium]